METETEKVPTLQEHLVETGARQLLHGLREHGLVPAAFLHREEEMLDICRSMEAEWLRGELAFVLYADALQEAQGRLRVREGGEERSGEGHS